LINANNYVDYIN